MGVSAPSLHIESTDSMIEVLAEQVVCLKRPIISALESSPPLLLYRANGRVCAIPTYRVYYEII